MSLPLRFKILHFPNNLNWDTISSGTMYLYCTSIIGFIRVDIFTSAVKRFIRVVSAIIVSIAIFVKSHTAVVPTWIFADAARRHGFHSRRQQCEHAHRRDGSGQPQPPPFHPPGNNNHPMLARYILIRTYVCM